MCSVTEWLGCWIEMADSGHCRCVTKCNSGQVVHTCVSVTKDINLVPVSAGKVTVGLPSHWPCITDNSGISTCELTALRTEMNTPHTLLRGTAHFTVTL